MASLAEQFEAASAHFGPIAGNYSDRQKLRMYALWNQATSGDVQGTAPSKLKNIRKWAKFDARKKCKGMTKEMAMKRYISELRSMDPDWTINGVDDNESEAKPKKTSSKAKKRKPVAKTGQALVKEFEQASNFVRNTNRFASFKSQRILLYSYYKQATVGPCDRKAPSLLSGREVYAKWKAWGNLFDMSQEEAMRLYIAQVRKIVPEYNGTDISTKEILAQELEDEDVEELEDHEIIELVTKNDPGTLKKRIQAASKNGGTIYLMTGATGFIGKFLVDCLLERNENSLILCVTRPASKHKLAKMVLKRNGKIGAGQVIALDGNISKPNFEFSKETFNALKKSGDGVSHFIHLAASYDMTASEEVNRIANVEGTRFAMRLAQDLEAKFEYTSSIVVAGDYNGVFLESNFDEGQQFNNPYAQTKFEAEKLVRKECTAKYRIYRPGVVVGHSQTGEADKIDGPYYFFKTLQKMRKILPSSLVLPMVDGDGMPIVPVDYVARSMDAIIHKEGDQYDSKAYQLVDPSPCSFLEGLNHFAQAAHAPTFSARIPNILDTLLPRSIVSKVEAIPLINSAPAFFAKNVFKIPESLVDYVDFRTTYDDSDTQEILAGTGIRCPPLKTYAWRLWDYYERFMDIRNIDQSEALRREIQNKVIVVTGSSDGIGLVLAKKLAKCGAHVCLVARNKDKLKKVQQEIASKGGKTSIYVADLAKEDSTNKMIENVLKDHGYIDILVNNAGRSIRRSVEYQYKGSGRFHDFTRTVDLNYYGSLRCILGFLPEMRKRKAGQIINISSIGAVTNAPRFGAYVASKMALDGFTKCISSEVASDNIALTTVYMPLVRTKMVVSEGNKFDHMNLLSPEDASGMIERAIVTKERTIATQTGRLVSAGFFLWPEMVESVLTILYKLEPEKAPEGQTTTVTAGGNKAQLKAISSLLAGAI